MSYTQWEGTLSEAHNNRGLLKIIWLTNCMLIYKVYVYLAIQDLLETARVPIYIHIYIGNFFSVNLCKIWPLCPQRVACGWKFFAHILDLNVISQNQGKKQRKNMLKINLPQMSISCMALEKKNDHHTQVGGWPSHV